MQSLPSILQTGTLVPADERMSHSLDSLEIRICGVELVYPARYFSAIREIYPRNVYLRVPGFSVKAGDIIVDLGCNEGLFSVLCSKLGARVIAVDAQGDFEAPLQEHLKRNACRGSVSFIHALIGGEKGLFSDGIDGSHHSMMPQPRILDDLLDDIDHVSLMKIDIEGSEFALFVDPANWAQKVDFIAMETHPEYGDAADLAAWLKERNFAVTIHKEGYIYASRRDAGVNSLE
jgi:FkbM family methyltransferase